MAQVKDLQLELVKKKQELTDVNEEIERLYVKRETLSERIEEIKSELKSLCENSEIILKYETDEYEWSQKMFKVLKNVFKIDEFRLLQKAAINATMNKLDCLLIMPTGSGKSLCFQLPALLSGGITLVVSPLISLMQDQLNALLELNILTAVLSSTTTKEENKEIFAKMIDPKSDLKMIYVTPEKLAKSKRVMAQIEKMYRCGNFARFVIDEFHCCSQWGHDFRPDYKFLRIMKTQFPTVPLLGLTATATSKVIIDVQKILSLEGSLIFKGSFFRSNLKYEIIETLNSNKERADEIYSLIKKRFYKQCGIIYCLKVKDTEDLALFLKEKGLKVGRYHSQLEPSDRQKTQNRWFKNELQIIVATVAFGMGINKMDVRFVIHHSMSKSVENYYQETGRAGRDGKIAHCILFYNFKDIFRASSLMYTERNGQDNVYKMLSYCLNKTTCRKEQMAKHFGDEWKKEDCTDMCDNCLGEADLKDINVIPLYMDIKKVLKFCTKELNERMTALKLMDSLFGKGDKMLRCESVQVPKLPRNYCEEIVARLLLEGYLQEDFHFTPYATISYIAEGDNYVDDKEINIPEKLYFKLPRKNTLLYTNSLLVSSKCKIETCSGSVKRKLDTGKNNNDDLNLNKVKKEN